MEYATLGGEGPTVSRLIFGCWLAGAHGWGKVEDTESVAAIRRALEVGINSFDTADVYGFGHSEEVLSKALGKARHQVVIATKFGVTWNEHGAIGRDASSQYVVQSLQASLKRLRVDTIPLYQLHWPDERIPISRTMESLERCRQKGMIGRIGCCNVSLPWLKEAIQYAPIAAVQLRHNLLHPISRSLLAFCQENAISVLVYEVLVKGLLACKFSEDSKFDSEDVRSRDREFSVDRFRSNLDVAARLKGAADRLHRTPAQVATRWALETPGVTAAIVGMRNAPQVDENRGSCGWNMSPLEREALLV